jgi:diguanylate cyclase (GGDEF)-like protein/PAS domain S-box-containing protein
VERDHSLHIGFSCFDAVYIWSLIGQTIQDEAKKLGIKTTIWGSPNVADQLLAIDTLVKQGIDALIISPIISNCPDFIPLLAKAKEKNIPIMLIGSEIDGVDFLPLVWSDHYGGQAQITQLVFEHVGRTGRVAYIRGRQGLAAHSLRTKAFHDVLQRYTGVELVFEDKHDPKLSFEDCGRNLTRQILAKAPDVNAIVTSVDRIAMGVLDVLKQQRLSGRIAVTGFDGIPHAFHAVHEGTLLGTVAQRGHELAKQALADTLKLVRGEAIAPKTLLPVQVITRGNVVGPALEAFRYLPGVLDQLAEDSKVRRELIDSLRSSEERFRSLVELSSDWYWEQDVNFRFVSNEGANARFLNPMLGKTLWELPNTGVMETQWQAHRSLLDKHEPFYDFEFQHVDADGKPCYISLSGRPVFDSHGSFKCYRGVGKDITERRKSADKIQNLAYYDVLTSLPNRSYFTQQINHALVVSKRHERKFAILFIDLDRFKTINDALGHEAGDQLLQEVGKRLKACLRAGDMVARFGGDEFVVLLEEIKEPQHAATVARKILASVAQSLWIGNYEHQVTASVGIAIYPDDGTDQQTLMKHADVAMYLAKDQGKNNFQFYSNTTNMHSHERLAMESSLRHALQHDEFLLHYQPKIDLRTNEITGMEALLRWQRPGAELVPPAQFIPLAEETGLIVPIGKWVIRTACVQIVAWQQRGLGGFPVAVNLSPRQFFDERLVTDVSEIIRETGVNPTLLEFEITESMVMYKTDKAIALLAALKAMGIRLAIDDFGTGYSSFALLKRFPIDTIKIDRSFIKDIPRDTEDGALTNAIISMGKAIKLKVIAEGVERKEQLVYLQKHACDEMQGFYFSKPVPAADVELLLDRSKVRKTTKPATTKKLKVVGKTKRGLTDLPDRRARTARK